MIISGDNKAIAAAYVKARKEMSALVKKDAKGVHGKYATLAALVEATDKAFNNNGLSIIQVPYTDEYGVVVETWMLHESGATIQFTPITMPLERKTTQSVGSAATYGRRYALSAICGIAPEDDDGEEAEKDAPEPRSAPTRAFKGSSGTTPLQRTQNATTREIEAKSLAHKRFWAIGQSVFAKDWDMARPWLLKQWSKHTTPDNVRTSASEFSDDEKTVLGDYMNETLSALQKAWEKQKQIAVAA